MEVVVSVGGWENGKEGMWGQRKGEGGIYREMRFVSYKNENVLKILHH